MRTILNPATGKQVQQFETHSVQTARTIIQTVHDAGAEWSEVSLERRCHLLEQLATVITSRREMLASLMTAEMGKPRREALAECDKCVSLCHYYATHAASFLADEALDGDQGQAWVCYRPLGVILGVMPWNFPLWQVFRFAVPTLTAGNTALLKHATIVSGCAMEIEGLFRAAGYPPDVFRVLRLPSNDMGFVVAHSAVRAVSVTGSVEAGRAVAETAGKHLKKCVLELGGSDPYIILEDADLDHAAAECAKTRMINAGQSCIAGKRFIVEQSVLQPFVDRFSAALQQYKSGDPDALTTDYGPLSSITARNHLHAQVQKCVRLGARCVLGGTIPNLPEAWYPPTLLTGVTAKMPAWDEELFGPVASVIAAEDCEEAIRIANATSFGLGGGIFTRNTARGKQIARERIESGTAVVNGFTRSDPARPFGGIGASGYGRELSQFGMREFVNIKTIVVNDPS